MRDHRQCSLFRWLFDDQGLCSDTGDFCDGPCNLLAEFDADAPLDDEYPLEFDDEEAPS